MQFHTLVKQKAYGVAHPSVARALANLGAAWFYLGKYENAVGLLERAQAIDLNTFGAAHPQAGANLNQLGRCYHSLGQVSLVFCYSFCSAGSFVFVICLVSHLSSVFSPSFPFYSTRAPCCVCARLLPSAALPWAPITRLLQAHSSGSQLHRTVRCASKCPRRVYTFI
jgi:hypothetical protein